MTKTKRSGAGWIFAVAVLIAILLVVAVPSVVRSEQDGGYPAALHATRNAIPAWAEQQEP